MKAVVGPETSEECRTLQPLIRLRSIKYSCWRISRELIEPLKHLSICTSKAFNTPIQLDCTHLRRKDWSSETKWFRIKICSSRLDYRKGRSRTPSKTIHSEIGHRRSGSGNSVYSIHLTTENSTNLLFYNFK